MSREGKTVWLLGIPRDDGIKIRLRHHQPKSRTGMEHTRAGGLNNLMFRVRGRSLPPSCASDSTTPILALDKSFPSLPTLPKSGVKVDAPDCVGHKRNLRKVYQSLRANFARIVHWHQERKAKLASPAAAQVVYLDKAVQTSTEDLEWSQCRVREDLRSHIRGQHLPRTKRRPKWQSLQSFLRSSHTPGTQSGGEDDSIQTSSTRSYGEVGGSSSGSLREGCDHLVPAFLHCRRHTSDTEKSAITLGTYESWYSEKTDSIQLPRPHVSRRAISDSSLADVPSQSAQEYTAVVNYVNRTSPFPRSFLVSDKKHLGAKLSPLASRDMVSVSPSSKARSRLEGPQSGTHSLSPLRQEIKLGFEDKEEGAFGSNQTGPMFRKPIDGSDIAEEDGLGLSHIPDHLQGSLLCPLHPKRRGGQLTFCPLHGQIPLRSEDAMGQSFTGPISVRPNEVDCFFEKGKEIAEQHGQRNPLAPAPPDRERNIMKLPTLLNPKGMTLDHSDSTQQPRRTNLGFFDAKREYS